MFRGQWLVGVYLAAAVAVIVAAAVSIWAYARQMVPATLPVPQTQDLSCSSRRAAVPGGVHDGIAAAAP